MVVLLFQIIAYPVSTRLLSSARVSTPRDPLRFSISVMLQHFPQQNCRWQGVELSPVASPTGRWRPEYEADPPPRPLLASFPENALHLVSGSRFGLPPHNRPCGS